MICISSIIGKYKSQQRLHWMVLISISLMLKALRFVDVAGRHVLMQYSSAGAYLI